MSARARLQRLAVTTAVAAVLSGAGFAPAAAQERPVAFQIAPQTLQGALIEYGRTTNRQLIFSSDDLRGRASAGLRGAHEPTAALDLILAGSGLAWRRTPSGAIEIARGSANRPQAAAAAANANDASLVSELVVAGSRLPDSKDRLTPVNTYTADTIARSGQTSLTGFLNTLPEVSVGSGSPITNFGGQSTVRLRGLPVGTTLVLLDGRRLSSSGVGGAAAVVDLNAFASDLLERVEIVPTGSSAVYGSDAIGGVINLVGRKRFSGVGGSVTRGFADDYNEVRAAIGLGRTFSRGSISLIGSWRDQDSLQLSDRALTADTDFRRFADRGGRDQRQQWCDPGTVFAASGNLNGLGAATAGIPAGSQPRPAIADFLPTAGQANVCHYLASRNIIPEISGISGMLNGEFELNPAVTLYADIFYSNYETDGRYRGFNVTRLATPASNAFNPFGQAVFVSTVMPVFNGAETKSEVLRPLVGVRGRLGGWSWDAAAWRNRTHDEVTQVVRNNTALNAALASSDPAAALNVFRPTANSAALLDSIFTRPANDYRTRQTGVDAVLRGSPLALPAGPLSVALGFEGGRERIDRVLLGSGSPVPTSGRRETYSLFFEGRVPLLAGEDGADPRLQATFAGRYDHYSDFGETTTPQATLEFRPLRRLSLRAAYSEAFKAPTLIQLFAGQTTQSNVMVDPKLGATYAITSINGGNPDLQPETGKASTFTATWRDPAWNNLRVSATYFTIEQESRIVSVVVTTILNNEDLFPERVVRGPPAPGAPVGRVVSIDNTNLNFGGLKLSGLDISASLDLPLAGGVLSPRIAVTRTLKYTSQLAPGTPFADRLSKATTDDVWAPRYKATVGAAWTKGPLVATAQARYVGRYLDYQTPANTNRLGDHWTVDASAELDLGEAPYVAHPGLEGVFARISVSNLLDRGPKYSNYLTGLIGMDPTVDDVLGRMVAITLGRRF